MAEDLNNYKSYNLERFFPDLTPQGWDKIAADLSLLAPRRTVDDEDAVISDRPTTLSVLSTPLETMKDDIISEMRTLLATNSVPVASAPMNTDPELTAKIAALESTVRDLSDENEDLRRKGQVLEDEIEEYQRFVEDLLTHVKTEKMYEDQDRYEELMGKAMERIGDDNVARKIRDASAKVLKLDIPKEKKIVIRAAATKTIDELNKEENRNNGSWTRKWGLFLLIIAGVAGFAKTVYSGSSFQNGNDNSGSSTFTDARTAAALQQDANIYNDPIFEEVQEVLQTATPSQKRDAEKIINAIENEEIVNDSDKSELRVFNITEDRSVNTMIGPEPQEYSQEELLELEEKWDISIKQYLLSNGVLDAAAQGVYNVIVGGIDPRLAYQIFVERMGGYTLAETGDSDAFGKNGLILKPTGRGLAEVVVSSFMKMNKWDALAFGLSSAAYVGLQIHPASQMLFVATTWTRTVALAKVGSNILFELATNGIDLKNGAFEVKENGEKVNLTELLQKQRGQKEEKLEEMVESIEISDLFQACQIYAFRKDDAVKYCEEVLQNYNALNIYGKVNVIQSLVAMDNSVYSGEFPKELAPILDMIEKVAKNNDLDLVHRIEQANKRCLGASNDLLVRSFANLPNDRKVYVKVVANLFEIGRFVLTKVDETIRSSLPQYIPDPDPAVETLLQAVQYCMKYRFKSECELRAALENVIDVAKDRYTQDLDFTGGDTPWLHFRNNYLEKYSDNMNRLLNERLETFDPETHNIYKNLPLTWNELLEKKKEMFDKYDATAFFQEAWKDESSRVILDRLVQQMLTVEMFEEMAKTDAFEEIMRGSDFSPREVKMAMEEQVQEEVSNMKNDTMRQIQNAVPLFQDKGYLNAVLQDNNTRSALYQYVETDAREKSEILAKVRELFDKVGDDKGTNANEEDDATFLSLSSSNEPTGSVSGLNIGTGTANLKAASTNSPAIYSDNVEEYVKSPAISKYNKIRSSVLRDEFDKVMKKTPLNKDAEDEIVAKFFKQLVDMSARGENTLHKDHIITSNLNLKSGEPIGSSGDLNVNTGNANGAEPIDENDVLRPADNDVKIVPTDSAAPSNNAPNVLRGEDARIEIIVPSDDNLFRQRLQNHFETVDVSQSRIQTRKSTLREGDNGAPKSDIAPSNAIQISNIKPVRRQRKTMLRKTMLTPVVKSNLHF